MLRLSITSALASILLLGCSSSERPPVHEKPMPADPRPPAANLASETVDLEAVAAALDPIAPTGEHPFSVLDLLEVDRVSSPTLSPDGT
ncbi:MAG TPA: hypothetical protein VK034_12375, partial [Enhygromyxa sp.]|nr:hypothetical protein [Enhygromyxa sp.]